MDMEEIDLIGKTTEVIVNGKVKEILVKDVFKNQNGKCLVEDSKGNIYPGDDINWTYKLSLGACLMVWLDKFGYINLEEAFGEDVDKYEAQLTDLFNLLEKQGYVSSDVDE